MIKPEMFLKMQTNTRFLRRKIGSNFAILQVKSGEVSCENNIAADVTLLAKNN